MAGVMWETGTAEEEAGGRQDLISKGEKFRF